MRGWVCGGGGVVAGAEGSHFFLGGGRGGLWGMGMLVGGRGFGGGFVGGGEAGREVGRGCSFCGGFFGTTYFFSFFERDFLKMMMMMRWGFLAFVCCDSSLL